jgi:hypothetical protein
MFLDTVMRLHASFSNMVGDCFEGHKGFMAAADKGCVIFVNSNKACAELLAMCCHALLDRGMGNKAMSESDIDRCVCVCVCVCACNRNSGSVVHGPHVVLNRNTYIACVCERAASIRACGGQTPCFSFAFRPCILNAGQRASPIVTNKTHILMCSSCMKR